jgi:hypothetical protein
MAATQTSLFDELPAPGAAVDSTLQERVLGRVKAAKAKGELSEACAAVLALLIEFWGLRHLRQDEIAEHARWLGAHPVHEAHRAERHQTTLRRVRGVVHELRTRHGVPVLSQAGGRGAGYYLPESTADAEAFLRRKEREARAAARSFMVTYHALHASLGLSSVYGEALAAAEPALTEAPEAEEPAAGREALDNTTTP